MTAMLAEITMGHYFLFALPGLLLGLWAQFKLSGTYSRYSQVGTLAGMSGAEAAREILDNAGLHSMPVNEVAGHLSDHYDPLKKALFLSSANYHGNSIAAVGVAAHEAGHALQHQAAYAPLQLRMAMVPLTSIASHIAMGLFLVGAFLAIGKLALIGVVVYAILAAFQLITLPVEYDASRRAKQQLVRLGIVRGEAEAAGVSKVLNAAALTYVAAMVQVAMTLLHFIMIYRSNDRH
ncbi:MAG: zinc metallopeptidase [Verrucomicrobiota bacterium]|nr:zinc metallopeptidase [Verrucomicrobiota bacterium]